MGCTLKHIMLLLLTERTIYRVAVAKGEYKEAVAGCSVYSVNKKVAGLIMAVENRHPSLYFHISCSSHTTSNVVNHPLI